ncbi:MAG TPA: hypothetical protein VF395_03885 [Polyangiaceae bacterium]
MTSARNRAAKRRLLPVGIGVLLSGCTIDFSGLSDLFDSTPTYLDLPGRRVASGHFQNAYVDGTEPSNSFFIAHELGEATPRFALFPFLGGAGCRTGRADSPSPHFTSSPLPPFVAYVENAYQGNPRRLHFTNPRCEEPLAPIDTAGLPFSTLDDPPGFLALASGDLLFLEPWAKKRTVVAAAVSQVVPSDDKIWSIEDGQLVVRDLKFKVLQHLGTDVKEFDHTDKSVPRVAFVDGTDLFVVTDKFETPKKIDSDVCNVQFPSGWHGRGIAYFSPCDSQQLVLFGSAHASDPGPGENDARYELGASVVGDPTVGFLGDETFAFFMSKPDPDLPTGLFGGAITEAPEHIADDPETSSRRPDVGSPLVSRVADLWQVKVDVTGDVGRLVRWKPGSPPKELARAVEYRDDPLAIINFDGKTGDLVRIDDAGVSRVLAKGVPKGGILSSDDGLAAVTDSDGSLGTLIVAPPDTFAFEKVAARVKAFRFIQNLHGIGYLQDFDSTAKTGLLGVRVIATGDTFELGVRASEWTEVGLPEPGVMYVVPDGERAGIWFARLK